MITHEELRSANSDRRPQLVEDFLITSIAAVRPPDAPRVESSATLADLGIDSLQIVELKFSLDQLLGVESDVAIIIANPTIRELAQTTVSAAGL